PCNHPGSILLGFQFCAASRHCLPAAGQDCDSRWFRAQLFRLQLGGTSWFLTSFFPIAAQQTISQSNIYQGIFPIEQGPPAPTPPTFPASGHLKAPPGTLLKTRPFDNKTEYVDSWNFTVELAANFRLSASYVGQCGPAPAWWRSSQPRLVRSSSPAR